MFQLKARENTRRRALFIAKSIYFGARVVITQKK